MCKPHSKKYETCGTVNRRDNEEKNNGIMNFNKKIAAKCAKGAMNSCKSQRQKQYGPSMAQQLIIVRKESERRSLAMAWFV